MAPSLFLKITETNLDNIHHYRVLNIIFQRIRK